MEKTLEECSGVEKECSMSLSPTAGIIVIGDEILKGHVKDTNSHFLCQELWKLGVRVMKISVIGDDLEDIASEVRAFSASYDFVLTSGGIGPTHDDVTMEGIGKAFNEEVIQHPDMMKSLFGNTKPSPDNAWIKMAMGLFSKSSVNFYLKQVYFTIDEDELAAPLRKLQGEFKDKVDIGSYPVDDRNASYSDKVTLEGREKDDVEECYCRLLALVNPESIKSVANSYSETEEEKENRRSLSWLCGHMSLERQAMIPVQLCDKLRVAVGSLEESLEHYSFDELCIAFNGGKDCTVLMHLFHSLLEHKHWVRKGPGAGRKIKALYVAADQPFREVEEFIRNCVDRYDLELITVTGSIRSALSGLKSSHPKIKAILMGTRYSDPYSDSLQTFSSTDPSWPQYMRVHPILKWSYHEVWLFLRIFKVPYCVLYDQGYTSLGNSTNTLPNSSLLNPSYLDTPLNHTTVGPYPHKQFLPAYMLKDESLERAGRNKKLSIKL